jgi:molecular chaperone GrpE
MSKQDEKNLPKADKHKVGADQLSELMKLLEEEKNRRIQLMADFENFKKRMEQERATFGAIANMGLIQQILEIHDDLQLAISDANLDKDSAIESIKTAQDKIKRAATLAGVEAVEIKIGDDFDSSKMEAITTVPDEKNKNKVVAVISSAYKYVGKDGIIKAAKVVVGK